MADSKKSDHVRLAMTWLLRARRKFQGAEHEQDAMGRRLIEHGATCYVNCAYELMAAEGLMPQGGEAGLDFLLEHLGEQPKGP